MKRKIFLAVIIAGWLAINAPAVFAQCGLPGTPPCPPPGKKPTPSKPPISKPTTPAKDSEADPAKSKFVPRAPVIEMVRIPAGSFMMGSNDNENEKPVHKVVISRDFWMGKYEVTQSQWRTVTGKNPSGNSNCNDCPVENVTWAEAQEFIAKLNKLQNEFTYRLPTESEWEYACRAGTTGDYYGNLDSIAWYEANSGDKTHPVGQKSPNAFGLYDTSGNVLEMVQDWKGEYPGGTVTDPTGAADGSSRTVRGGSYSMDGTAARSASRAFTQRAFRVNFVGFRLAGSK